MQGRNKNPALLSIKITLISSMAEEKNLDFEALQLRYNELKSDFDRHKQRTEEEHAMCSRNSESEVCSTVLMQLYDEVHRAWLNTASRDCSYFMDIIKNSLKARNYVIMDKQFFQLLSMYEKSWETISDIAEVIQCFRVGDPTLHNTVRDVFQVGLFDNTYGKIVRYPKITLNVYDNE
jgi:hypothetical protein